MKKAGHLSDMDNWTIAALEEFKTMVFSCGEWSAPQDEVLETKTVWLLRDISSHIGPSEYRSLSGGWSHYRHAGDASPLSSACANITSRITTRSNPA